MIRGAASKVMWVGRATVFLIGLAVVLALLFGAASAALAGTGVGAVFNLGKVNTVNAQSLLTGAITKTLLVIKNDSGPALGVSVPAGKPPIVASAGSGKAPNLDADKLDGNDAARFAGTGDSAYRGGASICNAGGAPFTSTLPVSVRRESLLFATARAGIQANTRANAGTLMRVELLRGNETVATTGFSSQAFSANATDFRDLVSEGVLKSGISSPSEARFVLRPGEDYVLRMTVSPNGDYCSQPQPHPMIWSSSLSYVLLGRP